MKLVDSPEEQRTLEELLDPSKPPVPADCRHLHYLLFTPFRYEARGDSRFRRAGATPGVFYAAEKLATAMAEFAFWRLLFFAESPATPWPANPLQVTTFRVRFETARCLDLIRPPFAAQAPDWTHPTDYGPAHALADQARAQGAEAIRAPSARDPLGGINLCLLSCAAFVSREPEDQRTWRLMTGGAGQFAQCEFPADALSYPRTAFERDPRIRDLLWER